MEKTNVRIQLYRVQGAEGSEPLEDVLQRMAGDSLEERVRKHGGADYRLEDVNVPGRRNGLWELNFVRMRDAHGPGRVSKRRALVGFDLGEDEYFGEDTAVLYDPVTRYAAIQYNHWGVRHSALEQYLSGYRQDVTNIYELRPKLDLDAERRFQEQDVVRRVEVGIDLTKMQPEDFRAGRSLNQVAKIGKEVGADRVYLTFSISSRDKRSKLKAAAKRLLNSARNNLEDDALLRLQSYGSEDIEHDFEVVDLLEHKLEEFEQVPVGTDRRITFEDRIRALKRARTKWARLIND